MPPASTCVICVPLIIHHFCVCNECTMLTGYTDALVCCHMLWTLHISEAFLKRKQTSDPLGEIFKTRDTRSLLCRKPGCKGASPTGNCEPSPEGGTFQMQEFLSKHQPTGAPPFTRRQPGPVPVVSRSAGGTGEVWAH